MEPASPLSPSEPVPDRADGPPPPGRPRFWRDPWVLGVAAVVLLALGLRLWGIRYGLPFAYTLDERSHFVPRAVGFFADGTLDPRYQLNPSGLIELIAAGLWLTHHGDVVQTWQTDPGAVWEVARVVSALVAVAAVALLAAAGARLFDRAVGLLAAGILATAFLPVFYGHLALNDAPSLAPTALALLGIGGILRGGRLRSYALAGLGVGLGVGLKYNAGFILLPVLTAAAVHAWPGRDERIAAAKGLLLAGVAALAGFAVADPYALLHPGFFRSELQHLSDYTAGGLLLGETQTSGFRYYAWSLGWGLGIVPVLMAAVGGVLLVVRARARALVLLPAVVLFVLLVGSQGRYFARYVMPIFPVLCLLAAVGAMWLVRAAAERAPRARWAITAAVVALVVGQGLLSSIHVDRVLARQDTRTTARAWMQAHIPAGATILVEPSVPKEWYRDGGLPGEEGSRAGYRWNRFVRTGEDIRALARRHPGARRTADFANYEYTLFPGLIDFYRRKGVCWIVSASSQSGRAFRNPGRVPGAIAYYKALEREADKVLEVSPFGGPGQGPRDYAGPEHYFQYDLAFNYQPQEFKVPGPVMRVYRLSGGRCGPRTS